MQAEDTNKPDCLSGEETDSATRPAVISFAQGQPSDHFCMGGKCASLAALIAIGAPVPAGFAVTTHAYTRMLDADGLREEIVALVAQHDPKDVVAQTQISKKIQGAFMRRSLPPGVAESIRAEYRKMSASEPNLPVAVRSSGTAEDMPDASFAGQGDTYLWVVGEEAVLDRVKACWASLYNARAMAYRAEQQVHDEDVMMAVGVQKMVDALSSGVAMTLDPVTGDRSKIVVEAAWGLGEMVVSGEITPDQFLIDKILLEPIKRKIATKPVELVPDVAEKKTIHRDVEPERQNIPSIDNDQIKTIAKIAKQLERHFGQPQDIEWAIDRHAAAIETDNFGVVLLQCRPETVWSNKAPTLAPKKIYSTGIDGIVNTLLTPVKIKKS